MEGKRIINLKRPPHMSEAVQTILHIIYRSNVVYDVDPLGEELLLLFDRLYRL